MEQADVQQRPPTRRRPLGEGSQQANTSFRSPSSSKSKRMASTGSASALPHHESLNPNGPMTVRNVTTSPENKRLSAVTNEESESKRDSQVSTTSSGKGRRRKTHIGPWELGSDIGKGGIGRVRKVRHCITGQQAAVKIIPKKVAETARAESLANLVESSKRPSFAAFSNVMPFGIEREVIIMKLLEHPNVVELYDVWENRSELYLIMEYVDGGELFDYIRDADCLEEDETVWLFRQMLAALLHCHRLGIHHRDLKPENILLDSASKNVKLADFGMAALQPKGRHLTTPCGSLHYAAPEVFERNYDGSKIDVWSLGIILFVMLTGTTPFYYDAEEYEGNPRAWFKVLKKGEFNIPPELSIEAGDLLSKMLLPDPQQRISLEGAWNHPFVHKYERFWDEPKGSGKLENWIGASPMIKEWNVKTRDDLDREILRNLRTLWHSEKESVLIDRLISPEPNHEKYFYYALLKHRDEQLENYSMVPDALSHSMSDYHHIGRARAKAPVPQASRSMLNTRTKSQFSILNDEHLQSRSSMLEPPQSERSYDPYRASRERFVSDQDHRTSVTVHQRAASKHSRNASGGQSLRHPASLRIEALKKEQMRVSTVSSAASLRQSSVSARSRTGASHRSMSRSSLASSMFSSSPPIAIKPSAKHKRAVDFSHLRKSSTTSALDSTRGTTNMPTTPRKHQSRQYLTPDIRDPLSSPTIYAENTVKSKKETGNGIRARRSRTNNQVIDTEARKVSTELEKYCEEAFNRSSGSSSHRTSAATSHGPYDTPPSSVSNRASSQSAHALTTPTNFKRPLPEAPSETPNTYAAREISETRNRLAARYAVDPGANSQTYTEVLAHLDALLKPPSQATDGKRAVSLPEPKYSGFFSDLPAISEEDRLQDDDNAKDSHGGAAEIPAYSTSHGRCRDAGVTIRLIEPSSPHRPAPLNIRKASSATTATTSQPPHGDTVRSRYYDPLPQHRLGRVTTPTSPVQLNMFSNLDTVAGRSPVSREHALPKKRTWWKRNKTSENAVAQPTTVRKGEDLDDCTRSPLAAEFDKTFRREAGPPGKHALMAGALQSPTSPVLPGKRPGFLKFFKRSPKSYIDEGYMTRREFNVDAGNPIDLLTSRVDEEQEPSTPSTKTAFSTSDRNNLTTFRQTRKDHAIEDTSRADPRDMGVQQHWLARFLHIKPVTRVTCFQTTRGRALGQVVRLLDNWRVHGIRDVQVDKAHNLIFGRLDTVNALGLKEVEFVIELFVVLQQGRRKGLSIARWTQRRGAASSFRRVVQEVEARFESKNLLVKDKSARKEMEVLLAEAVTS